MTVTSTAASSEAPGREVSLELIGLSRRFGSVVALDVLTFSVPPGEVVGFLGPNGAGKTTTMRAIFGVVALEAGQVRWQGRPVTEEARHRFGYMPEERGLYPSMQIWPAGPGPGSPWCSPATSSTWWSTSASRWRSSTAAGSSPRAPCRTWSAATGCG